MRVSILRVVEVSLLVYVVKRQLVKCECVIGYVNVNMQQVSNF